MPETRTSHQLRKDTRQGWDGQTDRQRVRESERQTDGQSKWMTQGMSLGITPETKHRWSQNQILDNTKISTTTIATSTKRSMVSSTPATSTSTYYKSATQADNTQHEHTTDQQQKQHPREQQSARARQKNDNTVLELKTEIIRKRHHQRAQNGGSGDCGICTSLLKPLGEEMPGEVSI